MARRHECDICGTIIPIDKEADLRSYTLLVYDANNYGLGGPSPWTSPSSDITVCYNCRSFLGMPRSGGEAHFRNWVIHVMTRFKGGSPQ